MIHSEASKNFLQELTILYVEDDVNISQEIHYFLKKRVKSVHIACNGKEGFEFYCEYKPDMIVTDIQMPVCNGIDMIKQIRQVDHTIPIIITTAHNDSLYFQQSVELDINAYLNKPLDLIKLYTAILKAAHPLKLLKEVQELTVLATTDMLTGINNRRHFFTLAQKLLETHQHNNLYALMVDIDNFKEINDTYGHDAGDKMIQHVSRTITSNIKPEAIVGRLGGEEFGVVCATDNDDDITPHIEKIRRDVENSCCCYNESSLQCTISIGVAKRSADDESIDDLLNAADSRLYEAKRRGKNRIRFR